ncbi:hypothetical protein HDU86_001266 [Geranomyces michiganensis]|nr:hypothetical protein HDU86_001266 [Geranomyces michiganensis]
MQPTLVVTPAAAAANTTTNVSDPRQSSPASAANQKVSWKVGVSLREIYQKLKRLHIAHSAPSVSRSNSESETSYTGPVRRNGSTVPRPGGQAERDPGGEDDEDDMDAADEIIVDGELNQAISSIGSRHHSIDGNSVASVSQTATTQDLEGAFSDYSHASGRYFGFGARLRQSKAILRVRAYFNSEFLDENIERQYQKEVWWLRKPLALMAACFVLLSWILIVALIPRPWSLYNHWSYIGLGGVFSIALPIAVIADVPRHSTGRWQLLLCITSLMWPVIFAIDIRVCGFYRNRPDGYFGGGDCGNRDFQTMLFYASAFPVIALFALKQTRLWAAGSMMAYLIVYSATILPDRITGIRTMVVYFSFSVFLNYMHYNHERLDRKVYLLRDELKRQFKATQRARHLEFKAGDSKKRFVSYIFHEVRVPLNAASLAVQNLEAEGLFQTCSQDQRDVVDALRGSLGMMAKVLNDVLDFNRMEEGKLVVTHNSLELHKVIRSLLVSARVVAQTRNITICMQLDPKIDKLQRKKLIVGDEMRLRQVLSNLVSNASKFTNPGGTVKVVTELLEPHMHGISSTTMTPTGSQTNMAGAAHDALQIDMEDFNPGRCVIRLEVQDTGVGIRRQDLVNNRLFSPYVQTDEGRRQGGKGTGLGLALVRHIVKLSGGRLGVKSSRGVGSTFWVELPFGLKDEERTPSVEYYPGDDSQYADVPTEQNPRDPVLRVQSAVTTLDRAGSPALAANGKPKKKVQIAEDDSSDDMSISDISVPSYPRTEANAEALRETLKDFGRVFSSGAKENLVPFSASKDRSSFSGSSGGDSLNATPSPLGQPPLLAESPPSTSPTSSGLSIIEELSATATVSRSPPLPPNPQQQPSGVDSTPQSPSSSTSASQALPLSPPEPTSPPSPNSLPSCPPPLPPPLNTVQPPLPAKAHVLIVDDDKITRLLMSRLISRMGHTIATAEDGSIALQKLMDALHPSNTFTPAALQHTQSAPGILTSLPGKTVADPLTTPSRPFDVVFLDNQMPVMTGVECIREIRRRDIPVWACGVTGNAMMEDQDEFYEAGIDRVLTKPVVEADVKAMIAMAMAQREPEYFGRETWRKANTPVDSEAGSR